MKNRWAIFGIALIALIAWVISKPPGRSGVSVPSSMIPPPVVVSLNRTNTPLRVFPGVTGVLIILPDGSLWRWGQTGGKSFSRAQVPEQVGTNCDWIQAFAANNHCVGLRADGTIWEWGYCGKNQVRPSPAQVDQDHDWVAIAAGDVHSVALKHDGTLWAWGSMNQLGNGRGPNQTNPVQVGTNRDWVAISCGQGSHTVAIRADGTLWVWGEIFGFENGQAGVVLPVPTQVCCETNWIGLAAGPVVQARTTSALWYPLKSPPNSTAPASSICLLLRSNSVPNHIATAFCGRPELYEIRSDGTLWARIYPIGIWAKTRDYHWRQIGKRADWVSIWGTGTALGLTSDGTIWMWGSDSGQAPIPEFGSRYNLLLARVLTRFGQPPTSVTTASAPPHQKDPRPLIRLLARPEARD